MKKITLLLLMLSMYIGFAQPTTNAPTPTKDASNVVSIYSDTYSNVNITNYNPGWGQSGSVDANYDPTGGGTNFVLAYTNFNYQGTDFTATNLSDMEYVHIDIWTSNATNVKFTPINNGTGVSEFLVNVTLVQNGWSSVDLPKSAFTGMTWDSVYQMKFDGQDGVTPSDIYVDNVYFWKTPTDPLKDASLNDLQVDNVTISGFGSGTLTYTYPVPAGTVTVPQITLASTTNSNATTVITQASGIPGDATVEVTSQDGSTTQTYTVSIIAEGPANAAPTPPARNASDVISIFSDAYNNISVDTFDTSWCAGTTTEVLIDGNPTKKVTGLGCEGVEFVTGRFDATGFTKFHMDIFTETATLDKSFNVKFSNWNGGTAEANAIEYSVNNGNFLTNPNPGTWISLDIDLSSFNAITNANINDIVQFVISSDLGTIYYDNLYLYKGTALGISGLDPNNFLIYPNPSHSQWLIKSDADPIITVDIVDVLGRTISSLKPDTKEVSIDAKQLPTGLYFAKISTQKGTGSFRLVKD